MKESFTKMNHKIKFLKAILEFKKGKKIPIKKLAAKHNWEVYNKEQK